MSEQTMSSRPELPIEWREPWNSLAETERAGLQQELEREIGPRHPLWKTGFLAIGRRGNCDDVAVQLANKSFAIVHLIWHGQIDPIPDRYPSTHLFDDVASFQSAIDHDAAEWTREE